MDTLEKGLSGSLFTQVTGVYCIEQIAGHGVYIGESVDVISRWRSHVHDLETRHHHCSALVQAWAKFGPDGFTFRLLEACPAPALGFREAHYVKVALKRGENVYNSLIPIQVGKAIRTLTRAEYFGSKPLGRRRVKHG